MPQQVRRFLFVVIMIFIFVVVISIGLPIIFSSISNSGSARSIDWTPVITQTTTPILIVTNSPTIQPSATAIVSLTPTVFSSCVYPIEYWMEHPEFWPEQLLFGNETFYRDDIKLILRSVSLDLHQMLLKFYYLAYLNIIAGADSTAIDNTLYQVNNWLYTYPFGDQLTEDGARIGVQLVQTLIDYNSGFLGPGLCQPYEASDRIIVTFEPTASATLTEIPSATPRPVIAQPTTIPTRTRKPADKPPKPTSEPPTKTPQPQSTATIPPTPKPTEVPPTPVPTEAPPPTPVP